MSDCPRNSSKEENDDVIRDITNKFSNSMSIGPVDLDTYTRRAKEAFKQGNPAQSLDILKEAYKHFRDEKIKARIQKLQTFISQMDTQSSDEDDEFIEVNNSGFMLNKAIYDNLYDHQKEGVAFLYGLHRDGKKGGVLADDMGLGKTIQVISFLCGMYDSDLMQHCLLVMPTTLITNWVREFEKWVPGMRVREYHGTSKVVRGKSLRKIQVKGGVLVTSYQMVMNNWELLSSIDGNEFYWDYVILDEAHKIKTSSTKTAKSVHAVLAKHRVLLTGTPVQNNLKEMWSLFDFACQGSLLGTYKTFKTQYENPITRAREKDATPGEKVLGLKMSENLMSIINPYFLRRTKADVQKDDKDEKKAEDQSSPKSSNSDGGVEVPSLPEKNDLIVWTYLSPIQEEIYRMFISLDHIKEVLMTTRSPLAELTILKKLCDHPRLLSDKAARELGLSGPDSALRENENETSASTIDGISDETLMSESGKLGFLIELLERHREEENRTLVFSRSVKMLNIIQRILKNRGFKIVRVDGTVTDLSEREKRIGRFQKDPSYTVFLLTTQVGGVGLTLTSANRVVIFDPSWNPATDAQAVDRAYRIGQTRNVIVYRLITCGTVEEKIYRRQVFKDSLIRQTTGDNKNPFRYFSKQELKELFSLEDTRSSTTQLQLQELHSKQQSSDPDLMAHVEYLYTKNMFGISHHDLLFCVRSAEDEVEGEEEQEYIDKRVLNAENLMKVESQIQGDLKKFELENTERRPTLQPPVRTGRQGSDSHGREKDPQMSPTYDEPIRLDESPNSSVTDGSTSVLESSRPGEVEALQSYPREGDADNVISVEDDADMFMDDDVGDHVVKVEEKISEQENIEPRSPLQGSGSHRREKDLQLPHPDQEPIVLDESNNQSPNTSVTDGNTPVMECDADDADMFIDDEGDLVFKAEEKFSDAGVKSLTNTAVEVGDEDEGLEGSERMNDEDEGDRKSPGTKDLSLQGQSSITTHNAISPVDDEEEQGEASREITEDQLVDEDDHVFRSRKKTFVIQSSDDEAGEKEEGEASREYTEDKPVDEDDHVFRSRKKTFVIHSSDEEEEDDDDDGDDGERSATGEETRSTPMESSRLSNFNEHGPADIKEEALDEQSFNEEEEEDGFVTGKKRQFAISSSEDEGGAEEEEAGPKTDSSPAQGNLRLDETTENDEGEMSEYSRDERQSSEEHDGSTAEEKSVFLTYSSDEEEDGKGEAKHSSKTATSTPSQGSYRMDDSNAVASGQDDINSTGNMEDYQASEDSIIISKRKIGVLRSDEEEEASDEDGDDQRESFQYSATSLLSMSGLADRSSSSVASRRSLVNNLMEKFEDVLMGEESSEEMFESDQENIFYGLDESG